MKHILASLLLALALAAGATYRGLVAAYWACSTDPDDRDCSAIRQQAETAYNRETAAFAAQMETDTAALNAGLDELSATVRQMVAYAACRARRHWWQVWRRRCALR
jgi:hypothetical protein